MFGRLLGWYTIYTFSGALAPKRILPGAKFSLRSRLGLSYIGSVTAQHLSSERQPNFAALNRVRHYVRQGDHHVEHWPTFGVFFSSLSAGLG